VAFLSYMDSAGMQRRVDLTNRVAIGRHPAQDIQLLDRIVSKEHAVIELRGDGYLIFDRDSRNGTLLNGEPVAHPTRLQDGDEITIGSTSFTFRKSDPEAELVRRVTVHDKMDSAIRTRVTSQLDVGFLPESQYTNIEQLRSDYEKLRIANELSQALSLEFDLERLLHKILDKAFAIFRCDRGVILIHDEGTDRFTPRAAKLRRNKAEAENIRISETILREVIEKHQGILSSDALMDSRFQGSHSIVIEGIRSSMSVPLLYDDRTLGIIHLDSQFAINAFSEKDLHLLSGFARQAAIAIEHSTLVARAKREAVTREKLSRLLPPVLVDEVLEGRMELRKGGDLKKATVLFADIRGFTAMSERIPPQDIVTMLNEYFEIMVEIIFKRGGTLDKFIGDEIMAIWGAPFPGPDDTSQAVRAAVEMQSALLEFNETRQNEGLDPIHIGVGLNTGEVVAGYMGSTRSMSYTVVGDIVNTAARICAVAGPGEIVIAARTLGEVRDSVEVEPMPPARVKGKREPVEVYRVRTMSQLTAPVGVVRRSKTVEGSY
jgi:adenylate cyclase